MSSNAKLFSLMDAYHRAHPTAEPLQSVWEYFDADELVAMLEGAKGRVIVFEATPSPTATAPASVTYHYA